jgi:hypothetical protein
MTGSRLTLERLTHCTIAHTYNYRHFIARLPAILKDSNATAGKKASAP